MVNLIYILLILTSQVEIQSITYGNGGGFSGAVNTYVLDKSGELYTENAFTEERTLLKTVDSHVAIDVFKSIHEDKILDININKPGNLYKFIDITMNGKHHKLVWSGNSENKRLNLLYNKLMKLNTTTE